MGAGDGEMGRGGEVDGKIRWRGKQKEGGKASI